MDKKFIKIWKGPVPFTVKDNLFFYGRKEEFNTITSYIQNSSITLIHGESGTGKTSMVYAKVVSHYKEMGIPVIDIRNWSFVGSLNDEKTLMGRLSEEVKKEIFVETNYKGHGELSEKLFEQIKKEETALTKLFSGNKLIEALNKVQEISGNGLLIVFDQLEELLRSHVNNGPHIQKMITSLNSYLLNTRIVLVTRSEYLADFMKLDKRLSGRLIKSFYHLEAMNVTNFNNIFREYADGSGKENPLDERAQDYICWLSLVDYKDSYKTYEEADKEAFQNHPIDIIVAQTMMNRLCQSALKENRPNIDFNAVKSDIGSLFPQDKDSESIKKKNNREVADKLLYQWFDNIMKDSVGVIHFRYTVYTLPHLSLGTVKTFQTFGKLLQKALGKSIIEIENKEKKNFADMLNYLRGKHILKGNAIRDEAFKDDSKNEDVEDGIWSLTHDRLGTVLEDWARDNFNNWHTHAVPKLRIAGTTILLDRRNEPNSESLKWIGCNLESADVKEHTGVFEQCDFNGSTFFNLTFKNFTFEKCRLYGAIFLNCTFLGVTFNNCELPGAVFKGLVIKSPGDSANNSGSVTFNKCDISNVVFNETNERKTNIKGNIIIRNSEFNFSSIQDIETITGSIKFTENSFVNFSMIENKGLSKVTVEEGCTINGLTGGIRKKDESSSSA